MYYCLVRWKSTYVSEGNISFIFRSEEEARQETNIKHVALRRYIPENKILYDRRCENLKSYNIYRWYRNTKLVENK